MAESKEKAIGNICTFKAHSATTIQRAVSPLSAAIRLVFGIALNAPDVTANRRGCARRSVLCVVDANASCENFPAVARGSHIRGFLPPLSTRCDLRRTAVVSPHDRVWRVFTSCGRGGRTRRFALRSPIKVLVAPTVKQPWLTDPNDQQYLSLALLISLPLAFVYSTRQSAPLLFAFAFCLPLIIAHFLFPTIRHKKKRISIADRTFVRQKFNIIRSLYKFVYETRNAYANIWLRLTRYIVNEYVVISQPVHK